MSDFYTAFDLVLGDEGGYSKNPTDKGKETKWGISKRQYPALDIARITKDHAGMIYYRDYWKPHRYAEIDSQAVANKVFDLAVNMGPTTANKFLQDAVDATPDGIIGPATLSIVNQADPTVVVTNMRKMQADRYRAIVARDSTQGVFLAGWLKRAQAV